MSSSAGGTNILDLDLILRGLEDRPWFEKNIPLLEVPDKNIQEVYYYRWQTYKEHLIYTGTEYGYMTSEFLNPVSYGAPYGGIVAAAGHHITEGRWIRDTRYGQDIAKYWLAGPGQFPKPMGDDINKDTSDWAHEYSFWAATALWRQYLVTGDKDFVIGQLTNLVKQYRGWDNHYSSPLGLYWQVPVWDATEYTAASYESSDPHHGVAGFRPMTNSYQYGDAIAIANMAALGGDSDLENEYRRRAESLQAAVQKHLWDNENDFYKHQARDDNPSGSLLGTREIMGYLPWMFDMPCNESQLAAFSQLKDPQGFFSKFGPTTAERRSKWFMYEAETCCRWNGPLWPFATSQTLTAIENVLQDCPAQKYITAMTTTTCCINALGHNTKIGNPTEDYNHSTFIDNVLAGLIGLRAQSGETIVVNPLTPSNWDYFAVENIAYHGHLITVLWDRTGSIYHRGQGLRVYVDGQLAGSRETIGLTKVEVGPSVPTPVSSRINIAANSQRDPRLPLAFASYTSPVDDPMRAINGMILRTDHLGVDLRKDQAVDNVRLFLYGDSDGVRIPTNYDLQYWKGNAWLSVPRQTRSPMPTNSNAETKIVFPSILTSRLRVEAPNAGSGVGWVLSELGIWSSSE
ncbi:uncharacterized protein FFB14_12091 [Fusarium fujikuroi]|nr:uncharacterized protein FFB14_12091 [Fusarium fujikuroi]